MIDLEPEHRLEVLRILAKFAPDWEIRAFGSRVAGGAQPFSDLDLAIVSDLPIPPERIATLRDAFAESDLPFMVDIVDWTSLSESMRATIVRSSNLLQQASGSTSNS